MDSSCCFFQRCAASSMELAIIWLIDLCLVARLLNLEKIVIVLIFFTSSMSQMHKYRLLYSSSVKSMLKFPSPNTRAPRSTISCGQQPIP